MGRTRIEDQSVDIGSELVQLARLALKGRPSDAQLFLRRSVRRLQQQDPALAERLRDLLRAAPVRDAPLRDVSAQPVPVDADTRLDLLRSEHPPVLPNEPIWPPHIEGTLAQFVLERQREAHLESEGLTPARSILLTGAPGVGKTLAARWLARELDRPLLILDLAAVMSSFLGRTGNNLRAVIDYAKQVKAVLLLDEFDAIAKRRDDAVELGELKRLVTVLLQEIDSWPPRGILIAATNHPELLDPAVWRRFDVVVEIPLPGSDELRRALADFSGEGEDFRQSSQPLETLLAHQSLSEVRRVIDRIRRDSIVLDVPVADRIAHEIQARAAALPKQQRLALASQLVASGVSQRSACAWTGVSRDTIRHHQLRAKKGVRDGSTP